MDDQEQRTEEREDVEAHRRKASFLASEEAESAKSKSEDEGDDDVEAHSLRYRPN
jgi:hypothetical protein